MQSKVYQGFGEKIREQRQSLGLTQEKVSEKLGLSISFYSRIEQGTREMSLDTLVKIARFFGLSLDYLLLDALQDEDSDKLHTEIDGIFRDKSEAQKELLLNLLRVQAENVKRLIP